MREQKQTTRIQKRLILNDSKQVHLKLVKGRFRIHYKTLSKHKQLWLSLSSKIYGMGKSRTLCIVKQCGVNPYKKSYLVSWFELKRLRHMFEKVVLLENKLRRKKSKKLRRLKLNGSLRGRRFKKNLPVRGQRTRTNSRTAKLKKKK